jgi:hypothetical protein
MFMRSAEQPFKKYIYLIGVFLLIVIVIRFQQRVSEMHQLEDQLSLVQAQGTAVVQTQSNLLTQVSYANSDQGVKEWAYREGRWYLPYETPIIIVADNSNSPSTNPILIEQTSPIQNWQVWWELFFGNNN